MPGREWPADPAWTVQPAPALGPNSTMFKQAFPMSALKASGKNVLRFGTPIPVRADARRAAGAMRP